MDQRVSIISVKMSGRGERIGCRLVKIQPSYVRSARELLISFDIAGAKVGIRVKNSLRKPEFAFELC
jgi:hypothetical protein